MADAELSAKLTTTSDIPQAMDKAKSATVSFSKQMDDIQKKFSTSFKDVFLGFLAPMVLIQGLISFISEETAKAKQAAKDGLDLLAKGETAYANSEEKKMANFIAAKKKREEEQLSAASGKIEIASWYLKTPAGKELADDYVKNKMGITPGQREFAMIKEGLSANKEIQDLALKAFLASPEGKAYQPIFNDKKDQNFKGPEGFSNVVGVGANPVMEAMAEQLEIQKQQLAALQEIANKGTSPTDFTKESK
jgi:hypothetical protein